MFFYRAVLSGAAEKRDKAYALLRDALKDTNKVGVAKVVIKTRQYLAGVKPEDGALVLELMHFADELRRSREASCSKERSRQTGNEPWPNHLSAAMTSENGTLKSNKDDYREATHGRDRGKSGNPAARKSKKAKGKARNRQKVEYRSRLLSPEEPRFVISLGQLRAERASEQTPWGRKITSQQREKGKRQIPRTAQAKIIS